MEIVGLVVAVSIAVVGWVVNGLLERRSVRRDKRIDYLLNAYRALDGAGNRVTPSDEQDRAIESAIADIQLLGTSVQIELANEFSAGFVGDGHADTSPLLESLRQDLRSELSLSVVSPRSIWLRIDRHDRWAEESARISARLRLAPPATGTPAASTAITAGPREIASVRSSEKRLNDFLTARFGAIDASTNAIDSAIAKQHVSDRSASVLEGIKIMSALAQQSPDKITSTEAGEFQTLVDAAIYAIKSE